MDRDELEAKAKELGINADDYEEDDKLEEAIKTKEEEEGGSADDDKDAEYYKSDAEKARKRRDQALKDKRKAQERATELEEKLKGLPDADEIEKIKKELKDLRDFRKQKEEEEEAATLKDKTELERKEIEFRKSFDSFKAEMEEKFSQAKQEVESVKTNLEKEKGRVKDLRKIRLKSEISDAASKYKAYKPSQIARLLESDFVYDDDIDKFVHYEKDEKGKLVDELSVNEYVEKFLKDPSNDNLVVSDVKGGTGHETGDVGGARPTKTTIKSNKYKVTDEKVTKAAEMKGISPEEVIELWVKRDNKLEERRKAAQDKSNV